MEPDVSPSRSPDIDRPASPCRCWLIGLLLLAATGCTSAPRSLEPRDLRILDGRDGAAIDWSTLVTRTDEVDVVLVGEEHDDPFAHAFQRALLRSMVDADARTALSMEMFERPEQTTLDRWSAGEIDTTEMVRETGAEGWGGPTGWWTWYQPILDVARAGAVPIVAANAPRTVVRRARLEGYEVLEALPEATRADFDLPVSLDQGTYWTTFHDTMREFRGDEVDEDDILATFRSQMVWDATMAQSIANAGDRPDVDRVLHLVGRFHIDHDGGTTRELRRLRPDRSVLTVSCVRAGLDRRTLATEDLGRADIVVYTPLATDRVVPIDEAP